MSATANEPARLLTEPEAIEWIPAAELTAGSRVGCIDGRSRCRAVGAPGGSAGELILALAVGEWLREGVYERDEIERLVTAFAHRLRGLYLHTDAAALAALTAHLGLAPGALDPVRPPAAVREQMLAAVTSPEHVGCGHLRAMLLEPDAYRVRPALVEAVIATVYRLAWTRADVVIDVLDGDHAESALAVFHTRQPVSDATLLPSIRDPYRSRFFVEHIAALRHLRHRAGAILRELDPRLSGCDPTIQALELERLGERHLSSTAARLGPELPRYRLSFDGQRRVTLEFAGA